MTEQEMLQHDAAMFHRVMALLEDMQMEHGTCQPRSRQACTHCNASDELREIQKAYKGPMYKLC